MERFIVAFAIKYLYIIFVVSVTHMVAIPSVVRSLPRQTRSLHLHYTRHYHPWVVHDSLTCQSFPPCISTCHVDSFASKLG